MGAHGFDLEMRTQMGMEQAYRHAVDEALREHGNDPYNGTIATTNGVIRASDAPMTRGEASRFTEEYFDGTRAVPGVEKWEAAGAIPLLPSGANETRSKKLTLDTVEFASYQKGNQDVIRDELKILKGYILGSFSIKDLDVSMKVETKGTEGERETRYFIEGNGFGPYRWQDGYPSQSLARAAADAKANAEATSMHEAQSQSWGIYGVTRRADGSPLVRTRRVVKRASMTVEYVMERKVSGRRPDGWLFFGWAAS